jgi:hypothetical protein
MHFKKKLAAIFDNVKSYQILTTIKRLEVIKNNESMLYEQRMHSDSLDEGMNLSLDNVAIKLHMNKNLDLTKHDHEMLLNQAKAVYGAEHIEIIIDKLDNNLNNSQASNDINQEKFDDDYKQDLLLSKLNASGKIWDKICIKLIHQYGINIYNNWFRKLSATQDNDNVILSSDNGFIANYVKDKYLTSILNIHENVTLDIYS